MLRPYQKISVEKTINFFKENDSGIIGLPTGTGKSHVIAAIANHYKGNQLVLSHDKNIISQNYQKIAGLMGEDKIGIWCAGLGIKDNSKPITIGTIQSVVNMPAKKIEMVIIDEAHRVNLRKNSQYKKLLDKLGCKKILGLTATPFRSDSGDLVGTFFDNYIVDYTYGDKFLSFFKENYLCKPITYEPLGEDMFKDVSIKGKDFDLTSLAEKYGESLVDIVQDGIRRSEKRNHILWFGCTILQIERILSILTEMGEKATALHSGLSKSEQRDRLHDFESGKIRHLINVDMLTTGYDFPAIDCIVMVRATLSPVLWPQCAGRGLRQHPNKENVLIIDYGANTSRLGPLNNIQASSLNRRSSAAKRKTKRKLTKTCDDCKMVHGLSIQICECGHDFLKFSLERKIREVEVLKKQNFVKIDSWKLTLNESRNGNKYLLLMFNNSVRIYFMFGFLRGEQQLLKTVRLFSNEYDIKFNFKLKDIKYIEPSFWKVKLESMLNREEEKYVSIRKEDNFYSIDDLKIMTEETIIETDNIKEA